MCRMAIQDFFSDEDRQRQAAITTSWVTAQQDLASPETAQRIRCALDALPAPDDEDLTPAQRLRYDARIRSTVSAQRTVQDPELMEWLRAVVERLDSEPPVTTEPTVLWDAAHFDEARWG
jgi:hypothetical protein